MSIATTKFSVILWGLAQLLQFQSKRHPAFLARLKERNMTFQLLARDEGTARWYKLEGGRVRKLRHTRSAPAGEIGNEDVAVKVKLGLVENDPSARPAFAAVEGAVEFAAE